MKPIIKITADAQDITGQIMPRLMSLDITDEIATTSDTVTIKLDDKGANTPIPRKGTKLKVWIGYAEESLVYKGGYTVDEVRVSGPPHIMTITARAANLRAELRKPHSRSFDDLTLGALVEKLAADSGLIARIDSSFASEMLTHVDQTEESDIHLLTRLAADRDAIAKPADGFLLFMKRGQSKSASGINLPAINLIAKDISNYSATLADREIYGSVVATWRNKETATTIEETAGSGEPSYRLRTEYPDQPNAKAAAAARLKRLNRTKGNVSITMPGRPETIAESPVNIKNIRPGVDGNWIIKKVSHKLSQGGHKMTLQLEPQK